MAVLPQGTPALLFAGPEKARLTVVLAHGAGAPMDSPFLTWTAEGLAARGLRTARFEFPYMAGRRTEGRRRPPDRLPVLLESWRAVVAELGRDRVVVGGKSMGGRVASLLADEMAAAGTPVPGVVCLGYPFHPPGREPGENRVAHLARMSTPTLILQGTRDTFGNPDDVAGYALSAAVQVHWLEDGDHDLKPRLASGRDWRGNRDEAMDAIAAFVGGL